MMNATCRNFSTLLRDHPKLITIILSLCACTLVDNSRVVFAFWEQHSNANKIHHLVAKHWQQWRLKSKVIKFVGRPRERIVNDSFCCRRPVSKNHSVICVWIGGTQQLPSHRTTIDWDGSKRVQEMKSKKKISSKVPKTVKRFTLFGWRRRWSQAN
jgi:hypothetical protein